MKRLHDPKYWLQLLIPTPKSPNQSTRTKHSPSRQREPISDNSIFPGKPSLYGASILNYFLPDT